MQKYPVGYNFPVPDVAINGIENYGGYSVVLSNDKVLICGITVVDFSASPIENASIAPVNSVLLKAHSENLPESERHKSIINTFDINDDDIYVLLTYGKFSYIFKELSEALAMSELLVTLKAQALMHSMQG